VMAGFTLLVAMRTAHFISNFMLTSQIWRLIWTESGDVLDGSEEEREKEVKMREVRYVFICDRCGLEMI